MARRTLDIRDLRMEMVARVAAGAALIVVLASFAYSFAAMKWVSDQLGADPEVLSYAFPFIIDLPALVASGLTVALHDRSIEVRRYAWSILVLFTSLSWVCNALHAVAHSTITATVPDPYGTLLVIVVAGFPPLGVVLGMHLWAFALRHSAGADLRADGTHPRATPARTVKAPQAAQSAQMPAQPAARPAQPARAPETEPARPLMAKETLVRAPSGDAERDRARAIFDRMVAADPINKPNAGAIHREAEATCNKATSRRWVTDWWAEHQESLGMAPADPIGAQIAAQGPAESASHVA